MILDKYREFEKLKCTYKTTHVRFSYYPDYCHYCGFSPMVIKNVKVCHALNNVEYEE